MLVLENIDRLIFSSPLVVHLLLLTLDVWRDETSATEQGMRSLRVLVWYTGECTVSIMNIDNGSKKLLTGIKIVIPVKY